MRLPVVVISFLLAGCLAAGCSGSVSGAGGDGYGCTAGTCSVSFEGTGTQDLTGKLGDGATIQVVSLGGGMTTVKVDGDTARLAKGSTQRIGAFTVTLVRRSMDDITLRVRRS